MVAPGAQETLHDARVGTAGCPTPKPAPRMSSEGGRQLTWPPRPATDCSQQRIHRPTSKAAARPQARSGLAPVSSVSDPPTQPQQTECFVLASPHRWQTGRIPPMPIATLHPLPPVRAPAPPTQPTMDLLPASELEPPVGQPLISASTTPALPEQKDSGPRLSGSLLLPLPPPGPGRTTPAVPTQGAIACSSPQIGHAAGRCRPQPRLPNTKSWENREKSFCSWR
mmetsp:Transcript_59303/g.158779  ORF Transcript_59303/g.158779 Transcript_59303/m.158779 type:complete len:225 (-) Transcript_59303:944-1618(-)